MSSIIWFHIKNIAGCRRLYLSIKKQHIRMKSLYNGNKDYYSSRIRTGLIFLDHLEASETKISTAKKIRKEECGKDTISALLQDPHLIVENLLKSIDMQFCRKIDQLSPREIFECLGILVKMNFNEVVYTQFYSKSIEILKTALKRDQLSEQDTIKLLFFAGLKKKEGALDVKFIIKYMPPFHKLQLKEQSIVADALFKCSIKMQKIHGSDMEKVIENNANLLIKGMHWLVPFCKAVRYIGPSDEFTAKNLSQAVINAQQTFDLTTSAHILSLYSEAYLKETSVLSRLFDDAFVDITPNSRIRTKDVNRLLWAARILNHQPTNSQLNQIISFIKQRFKQVEADNVHFMNILLSLWMFDCKLVEVLENCFKNRIFESIYNDKFKWKHLARLQLLLTCIKIEAPEIKIPANFQKAQNIGFKFGKNIKKLYKQLDVVKEDLHFSRLEMNCPIEGIYIPGVSASYRESQNIHIDVLDANTCLRGSYEPHGLLNLKLRLLKKIGYHSILITQEKINDFKILDKYMSDILH